MLHPFKSKNKRSGMILLIVVAFLAMFMVVGTTYLLVADSIRRTSEFDLNATDKRSDFALMPDIDPRYIFNIALGQIVYDVADPIGFDATGKILGTNSALRGHSLARDIYGGYIADGFNDRPFQGMGKDSATELNGSPNYMVVGPTNGIGIRDPEKGTRTTVNPNITKISSWNPPYTYPGKNHLYLGSYTLGTNGIPTITPSFFDPANPLLMDAAGLGLDVKNLEGYPGGNDSIWIDAGFPVMTTPDGRKYKTLIAPLILDLDGRINLNVAGNLMKRDIKPPPASQMPPVLDPYLADHTSNQGWGRWEINPKKLIEPLPGQPAYLGQPQYSPLLPSNEFLNLLSYGTNSGPAATLNTLGKNQWKNYGRLFQDNYLPINNNNPLSTNAFASPLWLHNYALLDFNGAGDSPNWGPTAQPSFATGFLSFGYGFGNGPAQEEQYLDCSNPLAPLYPYHARNFNPYRTQSNANGVSTVFPISETASILRWQGKGEPFSKSQLGQLLPKSLGLDMPYENAGVANSDGNFRQRIRNMVTTHSADLDRPTLTSIVADPLPLPNPLPNPLPDPITYKIRSFGFPERVLPITLMGQTYYAPIADTFSLAGIQNIPALKLNLDRKLTDFPDWDLNNYLNYAGNQPQFDQAVEDRRKFAQDIFDLLRNVTGVVKYPPIPPVDPSVVNDILEIKKANRWLAQLAANIVDFIDTDDYNTAFQWNTDSNGNKDSKDWVFGVELPRVVINEAYSMAQNDSTEDFNKDKMATKDTHLYTAVELMNPFPADPNFVAGPAGGPARPGRPGRPSAILQFKDATGTSYPNYKVVLCKRGPISGKMNALNGNYFNNTGSYEFIETNPAVAPNIAMDRDGMGKAILDDWTNAGSWELIPGSKIVVSDDTVFRTEADPKITANFTTASIKLQKIDKTIPPVDGHTPEFMLQKLVYPGLPPNDYDPITGLLANPMLPYYNPYITVDVFSKGRMNDLRKYADAVARMPDVTISVSSGRRSPYLDSAGLDSITLVNNMYNGNNSVNQAGGRGGAQHTMELGIPNSNLINPVMPWLTHLDRQLIKPMELIYVSTVKPHELTQTANRWNDSFTQPLDAVNNIPAKVSYPYAANWPWFDENTRLHRFLEVVNVSPLQAGEAIHGRVLGKVNVNTMPSEEVFQAVADAVPANFFTSPDVNTAYTNLVSLRPHASFAANGVNPATVSPATYARKELLTKIGNSVTTRSNVFAIWITIGYFEVANDTTQPPTLKTEVDNTTNPPTNKVVEMGKADGINIRHRMFAIVDRTNMVTGTGTSNVQINAPGPQGFSVNLTRPNILPPNNTFAIQNGMILTFRPNTDYEETVQIEEIFQPAPAPAFTPYTPRQFRANFQKTHPNGCTVINRGNPGPWIGYDRTKDKDVVIYSEIIE